ncbi:amidase [Neomicrococcus aestuarii]|uniref:Amidase n=1 Tax=Neomicrococcus aestuarii TaxID=556325 RepID=A0A1L2ZP23_9MICC|nr:amidase [Neomicrococcus aestuarii]APF40768.1 amidase [Neomicrococcus aestuarii]
MNLKFLDATALLEKFRSGEVSPAEVLDAQVAQHDSVNGDRETGINAFTEVLFEEARSQAQAAADIYAKARKTGDDTALRHAPLLGLTVATKEKHGLAGHTLEQGLLAHAGRVAKADHTVVARIREAGGIVHARATSPEFSCATVTHSPMWGITRNPWNLTTSPGGSSGGSGAALAAGMTTLATGSDIAGSTRIPAAFTGNVGYKTPFGRVPGMPPLSADWYRGDGPMARTVADTALLSRIMSGCSSIDHGSWGPGWKDEALTPFEKGLLGANYRNQGPEEALSGLTIGISRNLGNYPVAPSVAAAFETFVQALTQAGAVVLEIELSWTTEWMTETTFSHFGHILAPGMEAEMAGSDAPTAAYTDRFIRDAKEHAAKNSLVASLGFDARVQAELAVAMANVDVLLTPTNAVTHLDAAGDYLDGIEADGKHLGHYWEAHMTSPFNVANRCPVLSVPIGMSDVGVPVGMQIVGHPFEEDIVFRVGHAAEKVVNALGVMPVWGSHMQVG